MIENVIKGKRKRDTMSYEKRKCKKKDRIEQGRKGEQERERKKKQNAERHTKKIDKET